MGLTEVIVLVGLAVVLAAGMSALVVSIAVRRVRDNKGEHGKPSVGV